MIKISIKTFWDPNRLIRSAARAKQQVLRRSAAILRGIMRNSIRKKKGAAAPGQPPHGHTGALKNLILFDVGPSGVAVIGPAKRSDSTSVSVPATLEHGGMIRPRKRKQPRITRTGKVIVPKQTGSAKLVKVEPRPFVGPALEKFKTQYADLWKNCIK
jgi:hypothetical protein